MNHRIIGSAAAIALAAVTLVGCSAQSGGGAPDGDITVTYWTHVNAASNKVEKDLIADYEAANPHVHINYLPVDFASLPTKLTSAIVGGSGPDVVNYFQSYAAGLANKGYLAPVDYDALGVQSSEVEASYTDAILNGYTSNGQLLGVPHEISTYQFWINNDSFTNAGLDPASDFPETWAVVSKTAATIQDAPGGPQEGLVLSLNNPVRDSLILDAMARQAGKAMFSDDGTEAFVDSDAAVQALETWAGFAKDGVNDPSLGPNSSTTSDDLFGSGTGGMVNTGGTFNVANYAAVHPDLEYTVGQYPTFGDSDVGADLYGFGLYVPTTSKQQAAAWKFVAYLTSAESSKRYFTDAGVWLGDSALFDSSVTADFPHWDVFTRGYQRGFFFAPLVNYDEIIQSLENAIQRSVLNGVDPRQSLQQAQSEIEPLLTSE